MKKKFYTAKYDSVFKAIFCNPKNKHILKWFIEQCLKKEIKIIKINYPELIKDNVYDKSKTLDLLIEADGKVIDIEINNGYYRSLHIRNAGYLFDLYAKRVKAGDSYNKMHDIMQLGFTSLLPRNYPLLGTYYFIDPNTKIKFVNNIVCFEYNIDKIKKLCYTGDKEFKHIAMLDSNAKELDKLCVGDKIMEEFKDEVIRLNNDKEFVRFISAEEDAEKVQNTLIEDAEEKGKAIGIKEGKTLGIEEANKNNAVKMLKEGLDINLISKITGLTEEEIIALNNEE